MKSQNILPITHLQYQSAINNGIKQIEPKQNNTKVHQTTKKLLRSPQDVYRINDKSINCHFQFPIKSYQAAKRKKNKTQHQIKNIDNYENKSPKLWGCIVPNHQQAIINKILKQQYLKSQKRSRQYLKKQRGSSQPKSKLYDEAKLQNSSQVILKKYLSRKYRSNEKQPQMQTIHKNCEPKLQSPNQNISFNCDCQKLEQISRKMAKKKQQDKWTLKQTDFIKKLKRYEAKHYKSKKKYDSIGTTQHTRNIQNTQITEPDQLGFFFTNLQTDKIKGNYQHSAAFKNNIFDEYLEPSVKQSWQKNQNYNKNSHSQQYHQTDTSLNGKIHQLTELIRWRSKVLQKIETKTKQIKYNSAIH